MAEFIFDLQRFDGNDESGGTGYTNVGATGTGDTPAETTSSATGTGTKNPDEEKLAVTEDEVSVWGAFSYAEALAAYKAALEKNDYFTPNVYYGTAFADEISVSRYLGNSVVYNVDMYDVIDLVDANPGNVVGYDLENGALALIFDAQTLVCIDPVTELSPTFRFANGETKVYSTAAGAWMTPDELQLATNFWGNVATYTCVDNYSDTVFVGQGPSNSIVYNAQFGDNICLYDTSMSDIYYATVIDGKNINLLFNNGTSAIIDVDPSASISPTLYLASGEAVVYNYELAEWQTPEAAIADVAAREAEEAGKDAIIDTLDAMVWSQPYATSSGIDGEVNELFASRTVNNVVWNTEAQDDVNFFDSNLADVIGVCVNAHHIYVQFDTGTVTRVSSWDGISPTFNFASGESYAYNHENSTWQQVS